MERRRYMQDYIKQFDTFDDFFSWLEAPENDVEDGQSKELRQKQEFRRASIEIVRRKVSGDSLEARNKAMEKIGYEQRMQWVYEELHG
jgi:hypothetical protein